MGQLNLGCDYRLRVDSTGAGRAVLEFLAQRYRHSTREEWLARIGSAQVLVDGNPATEDQRLELGSEILWRRPPWVEPEAPLRYDVLHADTDIVAVDKPAGLPTLPGAGYLQSTLLHLVQQEFPNAAPLHRLGRWTSGIVLFARTETSRRALTQQWTTRQVEKRYRALASGVPTWDEQTVRAPIGPVAHPLLGTIHAVSADGKVAETTIRVLERRNDASLCDVWIATGRAHQIRIHLAAAGHPLLGDPVYVSGGLPAADSRAVPGDAGYALHAAELRFQHPTTGAKWSINCEPSPGPLRVQS